MREMKDSGVAWIGKIPETWETVRFKDHYKNKKEIAGEHSPEFERLALTLNGVIKRPKDDSEGLQPKEFDTYQILRENDFVFKMIDLQNISTSRVGLSPYTGLVSPAYIRFTSRKENQFNKFTYYFLMSMYYNCVFNSLGGDGVRSALNASDMGTLMIPNPNLAIQQKIAAHLDRKCTRIDALISNAQQQIEKLKAYKQSVITETVTKGLDPDVPMKDCGVEWIGEIPEHWNICQLKLFTETISKGTTPKNMAQYQNSVYSIRFLKSENIIDNHLSEAPPFFIEDSVHIGELSRSILASKDILFVIAGAAIGKVAIMDDTLLPANTNQAVSFIRVRKEFEEYIPLIWYLLQSNIMKRYIQLYAVQSAQPNLSMENLGYFPIIFSKDKTTAVKISQFLDHKCSQIDKLIALKQQKIEKLQQYKKSLIYEYVTGKKEVTA